MALVLLSLSEKTAEEAERCFGNETSFGGRGAKWRGGREVCLYVGTRRNVDLVFARLVRAERRPRLVGPTPSVNIQTPGFWRRGTLQSGVSAWRGFCETEKRLPN